MKTIKGFDPKKTVKMTKEQMAKVLEESKELAGKANAKVKTGFEGTMKYAKNLGKDTAEFVKTKPMNFIKKYPKKLALGAAIAGLMTGFAISFVKLVKTNIIQKEHIANQRTAINALKESCEDLKEIVAAQRDVIDAAKAE